MGSLEDSARERGRPREPAGATTARRCLNLACRRELAAGRRAYGYCDGGCARRDALGAPPTAVARALREGMADDGLMTYRALADALGLCLGTAFRLVRGSTPQRRTWAILRQSLIAGRLPPERPIDEEKRRRLKERRDNPDDPAHFTPEQRQRQRERIGAALTGRPQRPEWVAKRVESGRAAHLAAVGRANRAPEKRAGNALDVRLLNQQRWGFPLPATRYRWEHEAHVVADRLGLAPEAVWTVWQARLPGDAGSPRRGPKLHVAEARAMCRCLTAGMSYRQIARLTAPELRGAALVDEIGRLKKTHQRACQRGYCTCGAGAP